MTNLIPIDKLKNPKTHLPNADKTQLSIKIVAAATPASDIEKKSPTEKGSGDEATRISVP